MITLRTAVQADSPSVAACGCEAYVHSPAERIVNGDPRVMLRKQLSNVKEST